MVDPSAVPVDEEPLVISERDQSILAIGDENYKSLTWQELTEIVRQHDLARLSRRPSELLRYLRCKQTYERKYGSVLNYIVQERLKWGKEDGSNLPASNNFLGSPKDIKILQNDFPYGVDRGIIHLVVWSKARIPQDGTGRLTEDSAKMIESYVDQTFVRGLGLSDDDVLWFKNYAALQSVRELEHFHVLLNNVADGKLDSLLGASGSYDWA